MIIGKTGKTNIKFMNHVQSVYRRRRQIVRCLGKI